MPGSTHPDRSCEAGRLLLSGDYPALISCLTQARNERPAGYDRDAINRVRADCLHAWYRATRRADPDQATAVELRRDSVSDAIDDVARRCSATQEAMARSNELLARWRRPYEEPPR